ncbi:MAG TPA: ABC transporter ATP-binding protein [Candidatus Brocadiia bacterium]|nr:ABC transporter ATP-binding protein [Candidatus Brocadiia bacterium]
MIRLENASKVYKTHRGEVRALDGVSLEIEEGEFTVIRGPSGSGKSTILMCAGGMARPTSGKITVCGKDLYTMSPGDRAHFRAQNVGFVFQMFHLVPYLTALENAMLPLLAANTNGGRGEAERLLDHFGMSGRKSHKPAELSAGERQRVAMARALLNKPRLLLADEPTGNLDPENTRQIMDYLAEFHRGGGTVVVVTHANQAEEYARRVLVLRDGRIESETRRPAQ